MGLFSNPEKEKRKAAQARANAADARAREASEQNEKARQKANAASSMASSKASASYEKSRVQREKIEADKIKALAKLSPEEREKFYQDVEEQKRLEIELISEKRKKEIDLMTEKARREMELKIENEKNLQSLEQSKLELKIENEKSLQSLEQSKAEGKLKLKRLELEEKYKMWETLPAYEKEKILKKRDEEDNRIKNINSRNKKIVFGIWLLAVIVIFVSIITTSGFFAYLISSFTLMGAFMATLGFKPNNIRELDQWEKMLSLEEPEDDESIV